MWTGILGGLASDSVGLRWEHVSNKLQWCCWPRDHALSSKATLPLGKKRKGYVSRLVSVVESFLADQPWIPDWWVREGDWPTRWVVPWETTFLESASPSPTTSSPWDPTSSLPAAWTGGQNQAPRAEPTASDISAQPGVGDLVAQVQPPAGPPASGRPYSLCGLHWIGWALLVKKHITEWWQSLAVRGRQVELCLAGGEVE